MRILQFIPSKDLVMNPLNPLVILSLLVVSAPSTFAEPYSPSCATALEKVDEARKALLPFRRTIEMARAHEYKANGEAAACIGVGRWKVDKPIRCHKSQWKAPTPTKDDLAAVDEYRQDRRAFEELFTRAKQICLSEP